MQASFFSDIILHKPELFRAILVFNGLTSPADRHRTGQEDAGSIVHQGYDGENDPRAEEAAAELFSGVSENFVAGETVSGEPTGQFGISEKHDGRLSRWAEVPGLDVALLMTSRRFRSRFVSDVQPGYWDFGEESRRIALLPPEDVDRLVLTFGACIHGAELARIVLREQVLAVRAELGTQLYLYAIQRGRFQLGNIRQFFLVRDVQEDLFVKIQKHGRQAVAWCLAGWPKELRARCPHVPAAGEVPENLTPALRRTLWFGLKKLLVKEVAPQWAPCFD